MEALREAHVFIGPRFSLQFSVEVTGFKPVIKYGQRFLGCLVSAEQLVDMPRCFQALSLRTALDHVLSNRSPTGHRLPSVTRFGKGADRGIGRESIVRGSTTGPFREQACDVPLQPTTEVASQPCR